MRSSMNKVGWMNLLHAFVVEKIQIMKKINHFNLTVDVHSSEKSDHNVELRHDWHTQTWITCYKLIAKTKYQIQGLRSIRISLYDDKLCFTVQPILTTAPTSRSTLPANVSFGGQQGLKLTMKNASTVMSRYSVGTGVQVSKSSLIQREKKVSNASIICRQGTQ